MTVAFELDGRSFVALNGGPHFKFTPATSFQVDCKDQEEVDYFWEKLGEGGDPANHQCGKQDPLVGARRYLRYQNIFDARGGGHRLCYLAVLSMRRMLTILPFVCRLAVRQVRLELASHPKCAT